MNEHYLSFRFKSRYNTYGELSSKTKQVWFVLHGYGQLSKYFIRHFHGLDPQAHYIIAPEGTHRFYLSGYDGRVGASWMTKEDRDTDILNHKEQLDQLFSSIKPRIPEHALINVLGFSQGTATASRWVCLSQPLIHNLILWAGKFAHDVDLKANNHYLSSINLHLVLGDRDEYIDQAKFEVYQSFLRQNQIRFESLIFQGSHSIDEQALSTLTGSF